MGYSSLALVLILPNLSMRAELDGDQYILNGSKIWTSDATICDYIFVLVRTSPANPSTRVLV